MRCRALFRSQDTFAAEALHEVVFIPMLPEDVFLELRWDCQRPALVTTGDDFLEADHRVVELRVIIGAIQREGLLRLVFIKLRRPRIVCVPSNAAIQIPKSNRDMFASGVANPDTNPMIQTGIVSSAFSNLATHVIAGSKNPRYCFHAPTLT